jgi:putative FmdB family regulatory protein
MPLYEYECDRHGSFELVRPMSQSGESAACPTCRSAARRVITAPTLFTMSPSKRDAAFRNEQSRHEPRVCKSACGHSHRAGRGSAEPAGKLQAYTGPRPWVVEHR